MNFVKRMNRVVVFVLLTVAAMAFFPASGQAGTTPEAFRDCTGCHTSVAAGGGVTHPVSCASCHSTVHAADTKDPQGLAKPQPDLCYSCHEEGSLMAKGAGKGLESVHYPVSDGLCTACHNPHGSPNPRLLTTDVPELCYGCHETFSGTSVHSPVGLGLCTNCHNPHGSAAQALLRSDMPALCFECHSLSNFAGTFIHSPVIEGMCATCHSPHASDNERLLVFPAAELCMNCHILKDLDRRNPHQPAKDGMCTTCHSPHGSSTIFQLLSPINELCTMCHPAVLEEPHMIGGFGKDGHILSGVPDPRRPGRELSCTSCHNPHGSNNRVLLRFRQRSTMKICSNCHK